MFSAVISEHFSKIRMIISVVAAKIWYLKKCAVFIGPPCTYVAPQWRARMGCGGGDPSRGPGGRDPGGRPGVPWTWRHFTDTTLDFCVYFQLYARNPLLCHLIHFLDRIIHPYVVYPCYYTKLTLAINNGNYLTDQRRTSFNLVSGTFCGHFCRVFIALRWSPERWPSGMSDRLVQTGGYHGNGCCCPKASPCALPSSG